MGRFKDLTGQKFNRLTVIERAPNIGTHTAWRCRCDCGNEVIVTADNLKSRHTQSCGCLHREGLIERSTTHGMSHTKIFRTWQDMLKRCYNPNATGFDRYGGRGIKVCERWHVFENFYEDVSQMENYGKPGYSLDRIDNDGDYCPENCRWADIKTQNRNRRSNIKVEYKGVEMCLKDAAKLSGINYGTLHRRYYAGKRGDELFAPVQSPAASS